MTPEANPAYLSRQVWQAVSEHAFRSIYGCDLCPEQARIENLRPVYAIDEDEFQYGRQIWHFEAMGVTSTGRKQFIFGMIECSVQYGFLELRHSVFFDQSADREHCFAQLTHQVSDDPMMSASTRFWVWAAWASIAILTGGWVVALCRHLVASPLDFPG
jgi:hypothetical protein